jgi:hypothetical protein
MSDSDEIAGAERLFADATVMEPPASAAHSSLPLDP